MAQKSVLIVEDDLFLQKAYQTSFEAENMVVTVMPDGMKAMEVMKTTIPDLVILDLVMPKKNGMEVLKEMRQDEKLKNVKVMITTNMNQEADKELCKNLGITEEGYLVKTDHPIQEVVNRAKKLIGS